MKYKLFPLFHFPKSISIPSVPALIKKNLFRTNIIPFLNAGTGTSSISMVPSLSLCVSCFTPLIHTNL